MKPNIGTTDRIIRVILGLGIIGYGVATKSWIGAIGVVPLFTALIRWCPAYCPFKISTLGKDSGGCCGGSCGRSECD